MDRNFNLIWGFGISEKEIQKNKIDISKIVDKFHNVWIGEFFVWYNPDYWHEKFWFEFSPNGRFWENEQITSYETLKTAVSYIHNLKNKDNKTCEVYMAVNGWYYNDLTFPLLKKIIEEWEKAWVDGLIISSVEVLEYLAEIWYKWKIHISTIMALYNQDSIEFFLSYFQDKWLKLNRIIFSRELTLKEIRYLCEKFPDTNFEVFGHGDYCRYANGLCFAEHKYFNRDLCTMVLKHWLNIKKTIKHDFKKIILNETLSDIEKQKCLDNSISNIENIFTSQSVVNNNYNNDIMSQYIHILQDKYSNNDLQEISNKIYSLAKKELDLNFSKFLYDWLRDEKDLHNRFIDEFLLIFDLIKKYVSVEDRIQLKVNQIQKVKREAQLYFQNEIRTRWKFGMETYYKFLLYNRTSTPCYKFFDSIKNIKVVKIPLRWRDPSILMLGLDMIDDAIQNSSNYINYGILNGKYFHYDISELDYLDLE